MNRPPRRFSQVDVFTAEPLYGNPLAVVHDAQGLTDEQMAAIARWTNLSETSFLLPASDPHADYRVRIFTPKMEMPFAGHPTLGSCAAWLAAGGSPRRGDRVVQQCGIGLVSVRRDGRRLAFAAPPLRRAGPVEGDIGARITRALSLSRSEILDLQWVDNGAPWIGLRLANAERVLSLTPDFGQLRGLGVGVGVIGQTPAGSDYAFEVRAFARAGIEDPVTGSLNAGLAVWMTGAGLAPDGYRVGQGTVMGRRGRVHLNRVDGQVWVGGDVCQVVTGDMRV